MYVARLGATLSEARKTLQQVSGSSFTNGRSLRATEDSNIPNNYITDKLTANNIPVTFKVGVCEHVNGYTNKRLTPKHFCAFAVKSCVLEEHLVG